MNGTITIPKPEEIAQRINRCRQELAALKRLHRLAVAARKAEEAARDREMAQSREAAHV
jgi:hypothetical protein